MKEKVLGGRARGRRPGRATRRSSSAASGSVHPAGAARGAGRDRGRRKGRAAPAGRARRHARGLSQPHHGLRRAQHAGRDGRGRRRAGVGVPGDRRPLQVELSGATGSTEERLAGQVAEIRALNAVPPLPGPPFCGRGVRHPAGRPARFRRRVWPASTTSWPRSTAPSPGRGGDDGAHRPGGRASAHDHARPPDRAGCCCAGRATGSIRARSWTRRWPTGSLIELNANPLPARHGLAPSGEAAGPGAALRSARSTPTPTTRTGLAFVARRRNSARKGWLTRGEGAEHRSLANVQALLARRRERRGIEKIEPSCKMRTDADLRVLLPGQSQDLPVLRQDAGPGPRPCPGARTIRHCGW